MFHPKNVHTIDWDAPEQAFFDRDPLAFEVILNYYRNSKVSHLFFFFYFFFVFFFYFYFQRGEIEESGS
jgi:hypothetical protein